MAEVNASLHLTQLRTRLNTAIAVIAQRAAIRETKAAMQRQGRKPATIPKKKQPEATASRLAISRSSAA